LQNDHWMVAYAPSDRNLHFGILIQSLPQHSFTFEEEEKFCILFEHFERARQLAARPIDLTSHDAAVALVDDGGTLLSMSPATQAVIKAMDGLRTAAGVLVPELAAQRGEWNAMLRSAARAMQDGTAGGVILLRRSSGRRPLVATVDPLPSAARFYPSAEAKLLVRILDPENRLPVDTAWRWRAVLGLTPAEARLATALLECEGSVREAAAKLGIAYSTARVQLATMFHKTGTRTQAALTRLLITTSFTATRQRVWA
jgi:DNA-binding CsgD family transcriptional regulator